MLYQPQPFYYFRFPAIARVCIRSWPFQIQLQASRQEPVHWRRWFNTTTGEKTIYTNDVRNPLANPAFVGKRKRFWLQLPQQRKYSTLTVAVGWCSKPVTIERRINFLMPLSLLSFHVQQKTHHNMSSGSRNASLCQLGWGELAV